MQSCNHVLLVVYLICFSCNMGTVPGHTLLFADEALDAGAKVAVCSTSSERAVQKIVDVMLEPKVASQIRVFAGDMVPHKKPDPAIYHLAAQELGVEPSR